MTKHKVVWNDTDGDLRKSPKQANTRSTTVIDKKNIILHVRRLTSGKGRTVVEITNLPNLKEWSSALAKSLKKSLGVGGTFKNGYIEIHGEKIDLVTEQLDKQDIKWKKTGG